MITEKPFMDALGYCCQNKIPFILQLEGEINSAHYEIENDKPKFIVSVCNEKDENLPTIINDGLEKLKNFIKKVPGK